MGLFRLLLASLVVLGHLNINFFNLHLGISSVVVFYMLAGHVVGKLWHGSSEMSWSSRLRWFYMDRALRILPMYFTVMAFSTILWIAGAESIFLQQEPTATSWLSNLAIIPLNYYMYNGMEGFMLVPPSWSLGVELQFYLLVPFLLFSPACAVLAGMASFACYFMAQVGVLNADYFGYRLLAGVGFIFLLGSLISKKTTVSSSILLAAWVASLAYSIYMIIFGEIVAWNLDVSIGIACGLPLLLLFLKYPRSSHFQVIQRRSGEISYGVFLFHFPVLWLLQLLGYNGSFMPIYVILISGLLAWCAHFVVERPLWQRLRPMIQKKN